MAAEPTDKELVKRVQKGDKGAFDLLVLKYEHKIVNLVMRYVRDPEQALDISQEAFIKAYRALPRFRGDSAFYTWLYRIVVNLSIDHMRKSTRIKAVDVDEVKGGVGDPSDTPSRSLERSELRQEVHRALHRETRRCP